MTPVCSPLAAAAPPLQRHVRGAFNVGTHNPLEQHPKHPAPGHHPQVSCRPHRLQPVSSFTSTLTEAEHVYTIHHHIPALLCISTHRHAQAAHLTPKTKISTVTGCPADELAADSGELSLAIGPLPGLLRTLPIQTIIFRLLIAYLYICIRASRQQETDAFPAVSPHLAFTAPRPCWDPFIPTSLLSHPVSVPDCRDALRRSQIARCP